MGTQNLKIEVDLPLSPLSVIRDNLAMISDASRHLTPIINNARLCFHRYEELARFTRCQKKVKNISVSQRSMSVFVPIS